MLSLRLLTSALDTVSRFLSRAAGIQGHARTRLVKELQAICSKCEDGYTAVVEAMEPVRKSLADRAKLPDALDAFAVNPDLARRFKPSQLCGEVDQLLVDLRDWLNPLRYAWAVNELESLRNNLHQIESLDAALNNTFYSFGNEVASVSQRLRSATMEADAAAAQEYAGFLVNEFLDDVHEAIREIQKAKRRVILGNDAEGKTGGAAG